MSVEQITALIATIIGAPVLIELVKKWFEGRNIKLQSEESQDKARDERDWAALNQALERERKVYTDILQFEREQFSERLADFEARLVKLQEASQQYQQAYWEERVWREKLQARVEYLEKELVRREGGAKS